MTSYAAQEEDGADELNVTPLVDVALVLVIIFMVTAPLLHKSPVEARLPEAVASDRAETKQISITMSSAGKLALGDVVLPEHRLVARVAAELARDGPALVVLRADKGADAAAVVSLARKLRAAGATRIAVATLATPKRDRKA